MFHTVKLIGCMALSITGPGSGRKYVFKKDVQTQVDPRDIPYFESDPRRFQIFAGQDAVRPPARGKQIMRRTLAEMAPKRGKVIPPLAVAGDRRIAALKTNAEFRQKVLDARKNAKGLNAKNLEEAMIVVDRGEEIGI